MGKLLAKLSFRNIRLDQDIQILILLFASNLILNILTFSIIYDIIIYKIRLPDTLQKIGYNDKYAAMVVQNLYIIYQDGYTVDIELTKNLSFHLTQNVKAPNDKCGHFAVHDGLQLNIFFGSKGKKPKTYDMFLHPNPSTEEGIPLEMCVDASSVQVGNHFWIVGGNDHCGMIDTCIMLDKI